MKQVYMNYRTGEVFLEDVPVPQCKRGGVLVKNLYSAISVGTETLMLRTGRSSLVAKAKQRPDLVKRVLDKLRTEGLMETYRQVMGRLDEPIPLGYSCCGTVVEVGDGVTDLKVGDTVACFGSSYASHAEYVWVPKNLAVKVPKSVDPKAASFAGIASISLHAVRSASVSGGDTVVVYGLGLLGLNALQILKAFGCRVVGIDVSEDKLSLAKELGCDAVANASHEQEMIEKVKNVTGDRGADAVILMVSSGSMDVIHNASAMARSGATIVATGMLDLQIPRKDFFEKELRLVVSRSAGPGIFDENFELKGIEYPVQYVKWTERTNMECVLDLMAQGKLNVDRLITHVFDISQAKSVYDELAEGKLRPIGAVFKYAEAPTKIMPQQRTIAVNTRPPKSSSEVVAGVVGAGLFAKGTILPILSKLQKAGSIRLKILATTTGVSSHYFAKKFDFEHATTDYHEILNDSEINAVFILTQHNTHAKLVQEALLAGKHVFVEKPLAITYEELEATRKIYEQASHRLLMVGFNRRFSRHTRFVMSAFENAEGPFVFLARVNAGYLPSNHWVLDPQRGGGRLVGEACHFIDLMVTMTGEVPVSLKITTIESKNGYNSRDNAVLTFKLSEGSIGTIVYYSNGNKRFPRELIEISGNGLNGRIENFTRSVVVVDGVQRRFKTFGISWGHKEELEVFVQSVKNGIQPVPFDEIYQVSHFSILAENLALRAGEGKE